MGMRKLDDVKKLNETQKSIFKQICKIVLNEDSNLFMIEGRINYEALKTAIVMKFYTDKDLKVWDIVAKHFKGSKILLDSGSLLSLPLAFNSVVCFHQREFK